MFNSVHDMKIERLDSVSTIADGIAVKEPGENTFRIELIDKPGQLLDVSRIFAELGANVISVHHERANEGSAVNGCYLRITLETRNYEHITQIKKALDSHGFRIVGEI